MVKRSEIYVVFLITIVGILLTYFLVSMQAESVYPFAGGDSKGYVEQGRNYSEDQGLTVLQRDGKLTPVLRRPPGYPIAIAAVSKLGVEPDRAALFISWASWSLVSLALWYALRSFVGNWKGAFVGLTVYFSPGVFKWGYQALTDILFLVLSALSLGALISSCCKKSPVYWVLLSGVLCGLAYSVRNAGVALIFATIFAIAAAHVMKIWPLRDAAYKLVFWTIGLLFVVSPLIIRNLMVFDSVNPYPETESPFGWIDSIRIVFWSLVYDLSGSHFLADQFAWNWKVGLPAISSVFIALVFLTYRQLEEAASVERLALVLFLSYMIAGTGMIIIGRASTDWIETELVRHMLQYSWLCLALVVWVVGGKGDSFFKTGNLLAAIMLSTLLVSHVLNSRDSIERSNEVYEVLAGALSIDQATKTIPKDIVITGQLKRFFASDPSLAESIISLPKNSVVISNYPEITYISFGIPSVQLEIKDERAVKYLAKVASDLSKKWKVFVVLFPTNRMLRSEGTVTWKTSLTGGLGESFRIYKESPNWIFARYIGS